MAKNESLHLGAIVSIIIWKAQGVPRIAVKQNFRPYIRRYTSPNEKFEYSYPLIYKCFNIDLHII